VLGRWTGVALLLLGVASAPAPAGELRQITLNDGSVITGEIESAQGGIYTVRSPSLGRVTIRDSEIRSIAAPGAPPSTDSGAPGALPPTGNPQLDAVQQRILADDSIMSSVAALQSDPQIEAVLNDPDIMEALRAGNIDALEHNPKFRSLLDDPALQEITRKLAH